MKTLRFIFGLIVILLLISVLNGCSNSSEGSAAETGKQLYTCGMHPEIISEESGYCPICNMKLTPKKSGSDQSKGSVVIDPVTVQNMGLKTTTASYAIITRAIRASGKVDYSEPNLYSVNLKVPGWIEKLYINYEGANVKAGDPLFEIYSPELVAAQEEYLTAIDAKYSKNSIKSPEKRLENMGITKKQIMELARSQQVSDKMTIKSPATGIVIMKNINDGEQVKVGRELFKISDISTVWIIADLYEQDIPFVKLGDEVEIKIPSRADRNFNGRISYISPHLNSKQQTKIRIDVKNPEFKLKPGMYAEVIVNSQLPEKSLTIPFSAVIHSGEKSIVYIAHDDGSYEPRLVTTGSCGKDDLVEIRSGLKEGETIVTSGQFLIDSESRLNESLDMGHMHHDGMQSSTTEKMKMESEEESKHDMHTHHNHSDDEKLHIYTCPMPVHFNVLQFGEGDCPECGMDLVPVEETSNTEVYYCPMLEDSVVTNQPGKCPKCGMNLDKLNTGGEND
ncbi:MAG: efflux RND transporter periplasmic adaptor subunit [candidate division Zixibacteria bacterium]|nr:efflux RND transporter periplasmic adaptor subunit [candidate division Zixibacteria bacterium]